VDIRKSSVGNIYNDIIPKLTISKVEWMKYLEFSSRIWKHRFDSQILIYAQKPNATFVADMNIWNNKINRYINKGAKAIKVFDTSKTPVMINLLFDVSDTNGDESTYPKTWILNNEYKKLLNDRYNKKYNTDNISLRETIAYLCGQYSEIVYKSYITDVDKQISILDNLLFNNFDDKFKLTLTESMIYLISLRCNIGEDLDTTKLFKYISEFKSKGDIIKLCSSVSNTSQIILRDIEKEINSLIRERKLKGGRNKLQGRERSIISTDRVRRESSGTGTDREVRNVSNELSERDGSAEVHSTIYERRADESDEKSKRGSIRIIGSDNRKEINGRSDNKSDERIRKLQTQGYDTEGSRRDSIERNSVQEEIEDNIELHDDSYSSFILPKATKKINYIYKEDKMYGGLKTKFKNNLEAIKIIKVIEKESRLASSKEQSILAKYSGWGGMPQVFDEKIGSWANEFKELKDLLTEDEYISARASTPNAHYTSKEVIKAIYLALDNFGFSKGNVLEPSMGIGYFFSLLPEKMRESQLFGVELDDISGRISKQLYQEAEIQIKGYQDTEFENNFFDVAIGNVPFGDYKVYDREYNKYNFFIHDYFIAKTLDKVRPGGIISFVTSKGTMDKQDTSVRKYIAERADLIGAIRLPNNTFKEIANTDVTTDILFLQKRDSINLSIPEWINVGYNDEGVPLNQYYIDNPHMMLGKMVFDERRKGMFGEESKVTALINTDDNFNIEAALDNAISYLHADIKKYIISKEGYEIDKVNKDLPADLNVKNFTFTVINNKIYYRENAVMRFMDIEGKTKERIEKLNEIRNSLRNIIHEQLAGCTDELLKTLQNNLNNKYDSFVKAYGNITDKLNKKAFRDDSDYPLLCSLEVIDEDKNVVKADIFTKRTISHSKKIDKVDTAFEGLTISMNEKGKVDLEYIGSLCNTNVDNVINDLKGIIFLNPQKFDENNVHIGWESKDEYLSGNVREN